MMLRCYIFLSLLLGAVLCGKAQSPAIPINDSTGHTILLLQDGQFKDAKTKELLVNVKGNLVFKADSDNKDDILLMVKVKDLFKKQIGEVLTSDMKKVLFSTYNGNFYLGGAGSGSSHLLASYEQKKNDPIKLYHGVTGKLIATVNGGEPTTGELAALVYLLNNAYQIDEAVIAKVQAQPEENQPYFDVSQTSGTIRRMWGSGQEEYVWDGRTIKRRWSPVEFEEWVFDGVTLERAWYRDNQELVWDGEVLKRKWYASPDEFVYEDNSIQRRYGPTSEEFLIQGNVVKKMWSTSGNNDEWQIDGEIPVPVIILVVYGLIRK